MVTPPGANPESAPAGRVNAALGAITRHIRANALGPGDRLPSEAELSRTLHVSRSVVREALRSLAALKLIDLQPGRRAVLSPLDNEAMAPVIAHGVHTGEITILQVYDVRRTIETRTAELAALRATPEEAAALHKLVEEMQENLASPPLVMAADLAFHRTLARASQNPVFALIVGAFDSVTQDTWPVGWRSHRTEEEQLAVIAIHREVADAVAEGDPVAAGGAMIRHFDVSGRMLVAAGLA